MTKGERVRAIRAQGNVCAWCAIPIPLRADVIERPAGPLAFCKTCTRRYRNRDEHPYLHKCLEHQGR